MKIENIVFEGGGVKGLAYVGALEILNKSGFLGNIKGLGGASAGAIIAALYAVGYSPEELFSVVKELNFHTLRGKSFILNRLYSLLTNYGLFSTEHLNAWLADLIKEKAGSADLTFKQLKQSKNIDLRITASDIVLSKSVVFSCETSPDMSICKAVTISASYPLYFQPQKLDGRPMLDGGLLRNYPLRVFDTEGKANPYTIGLRVDTTQEVEASANGSFESNPADLSGSISTRLARFIMAILNALLNYASKSHLSDEDWLRTVYIDCKEVKPLDFNLEYAGKLLLVERGRVGMRKYLSKLNYITI